MAATGESVREIDFEHVEEIVASLDRMSDDVYHRRATAGNLAADLALRFCIENECYSDLGGVKSFWDEVDNSIRENQGQLAIYTNYNPSLSPVLAAGRLAENNHGLELEEGDVSLPIETYYIGDWFGNWTRASKDTEVPYIGTGYTKSENREGKMHPNALGGSAMTKRGAYMAIAFAFGNEQSRQMLQDEYGKYGDRRGKEKDKKVGRFAKKINSELFVINPEKIYSYLQKKA